MEGLHRTLYLYVDVAQVEQVHIHACCLGSSGITFQEETRSTAAVPSNTPLIQPQSFYTPNLTPPESYFHCDSRGVQVQRVHH